MGSSDNLPVETHHRRENFIEPHDTERQKNLYKYRLRISRKYTDTLQMPRTPRIAQRRLTSTPLHPNDRNGNNFDELSFIPTI